MENDPALHMVDSLERGIMKILKIYPVPFIGLNGIVFYLSIFGVKK